MVVEEKEVAVEGGAVEQVRALFDYEPAPPGELPLKQGQVVRVLEQHGDGWWRVEARGAAGLVPGSYLEPLLGPRASLEPPEEELEISAELDQIRRVSSGEAAQIAHRRLSGQGLSPSADSVSPM